MFRAVPLSVIRSFSLYTTQWYMSYTISRTYFWNRILHVSDSSSVHHQEFFTLHTAMVYVIQVLLTACEQDEDGLFSLYTYIYIYLFIENRLIPTIFKFMVPCIVILG